MRETNRLNDARTRDGDRDVTITDIETCVVDGKFE